MYLNSIRKILPFTFLLLCLRIHSHIHCYIKSVLLLESSEEFIKEATSLIQTVITVTMSEIPFLKFVYSSILPASWIEIMQGLQEKKIPPGTYRHTVHKCLYLRSGAVLSISFSFSHCQEGSILHLMLQTSRVPGVECTVSHPHLFC